MGNHVEVFVHIVWGTHARRPLLAVDLEAAVHRSIAAKCTELGCAPIAIGGTDDHVHLFTRLHPTTPLSTLVEQVKGVSSHLANRRRPDNQPFRWQPGYGAFSISTEDAPAVERYVLNQKQHHRKHALNPRLELDDGRDGGLTTPRC